MPLSKEERKDLRLHYSALARIKLNRIQTALNPIAALEVALRRLEKANEEAKEALAYVERIAADQEGLAGLKKDLHADCTLLVEIDSFDSISAAKSRHKAIRHALDSEYWEKE